MTVEDMKAGDESHTEPESIKEGTEAAAEPSDGPTTSTERDPDAGQTPSRAQQKRTRSVREHSSSALRTQPASDRDESAKRARLPFKPPVAGDKASTPARSGALRPFKPPGAGVFASTPSRPIATPSKSAKSTPYRPPVLGAGSTTSPVKSRGTSNIALTAECARLERRIQVLRQALRYRTLPDDHSGSLASLQKAGDAWRDYGRSAADKLWSVMGGKEGEPVDDGAFTNDRSFNDSAFYDEDDRRKKSWNASDEEYGPSAGVEKEDDEDDPLPEDGLPISRKSSGIETAKQPVRYASFTISRTQWSVATMLTRMQVDPIGLFGWNEDDEEWKD